MSQNFYNSLALALLGPQANPNSPSTALSPQLLYTYKALVANQTDLAKAYRSAETKETLANLKNIVSIYSTAQKAQTAAFSDIARTRQVNSQNITKLKDGALKTLERATSKQTSVDKDKRRSIIEAGEARKATNNSTLKQNILYEATVTRFVSTDPVDPDNTKALGTISDILQETVGAGLSDGDIVAKVRDFTEGSSLQNDIVQKIIEYKTAYDDIGFVVRKANSMIGSLNEYGKELEGVTAGTPEAAAKVAESNDKLGKALKAYGDTLKASESAARQSMEDTAEFYDTYLSAAAQYEPALKAISDRIIGRQSNTLLRGQAVSTPGFKSWAKDNGFDNLGFIKDGAYIEGADDTEALMLFKYQQMHPEKYRPGLFSDSGETGVMVKIERKASPAELNQYLTAPDGTFFTYTAPDGTTKYLKKDSDVVNVVKKGGVKITAGDGTTLVLDVNYEDLNDADSDLYKLVDGFGAGKANAAQKAFNADKEKFVNGPGKQLLDIILDEPVVRDAETGKVDEEETFKRLSRIKALKIVKVDPQGIVSVPSVDTLEDILEGYSIDSSKSDRPYEVMKPGEDAFRKLIGEKSGVALGIKEGITKEPVTFEFAEVLRPHASHVGPEGFRTKIVTAEGEAFLDRNQTIVDSTTANMPGGAIALRVEDPKERFERLKAVETGVSPSELKVRKATPMLTEEEFEAKAEESFVNALLPDARAVYRRQEKEKQEKTKKDEKATDAPLVAIMEGLEVPADLFDAQVVAAAQQKAFDASVDTPDKLGQALDLPAEEQQEIGKGLLQEQYNLMIKGGAEPIEAASALGMIPSLIPMPPVSPEPFEVSLTPRARRQRRREDIRSIAEQMAATGTVPTSRQELGGILARQRRLARFRDLEVPVFQDPRDSAPESFMGVQEKTIQQPEDILTGDRAEDKEGIVIAGTSGRSLDLDKTGAPFESSRVLVKGSAPTSSEDREIIAATLGERADIAAAASGLGAGSKAKDSRIIYSDAIAARELAKKRKPKGEEESAEDYKRRIAAEAAKIERSLTKRDPKEFDTSF